MTFTRYSIQAQYIWSNTDNRYQQYITNTCLPQTHDMQDPAWRFPTCGIFEHPAVSVTVWNSTSGTSGWCPVTSLTAQVSSVTEHGAVKNLCVLNAFSGREGRVWSISLCLPEHLTVATHLMPPQASLSFRGKTVAYTEYFLVSKRVSLQTCAQPKPTYPLLIEPRQSASCSFTTIKKNPTTVLSTCQFSFDSFCPSTNICFHINLAKINKTWQPSCN